jgi:hypothetical protein
LHSHATELLRLLLGSAVGVGREALCGRRLPIAGRSAHARRSSASWGRLAVAATTAAWRLAVAAATTATRRSVSTTTTARRGLPSTLHRILLELSQSTTLTLLPEVVTARRSPAIEQRQAPPVDHADASSTKRSATSTRARSFRRTGS